MNANMKNTVAGKVVKKKRENKREKRTRRKRKRRNMHCDNTEVFNGEQTAGKCKLHRR